MGEVAEISSASRVHKEDWMKEGVPFFRSSDVVSAFKNAENVKAYISYDLYKELVAKSGKVRKGDVLVTGGGSIAIPYIVTSEDPLYFKDADLIWFKMNQFLNGSFVYYFYSSPKLRNYVSTISHVGTIPHYTIEQAKATPLSLPSVPEQTAISNFFRTLDDAITLHKRKLEGLKELKSAYLQQMFPQAGENLPRVRFAGFTGDWKKRKLGEISTKISDKNRNNEFHETLTNSAEYGIISQRDYFEKDISNEKNLDGYFIVRPNDFVYNPRISNFAPVGPVKRNLLGRTGVMSPLYYVFRITKGNHTFVEKYFETAYWHDFMVLNGDNGVRSDRFNIKDSIFIEMPIPFPSVEEQTLVGSFLRNLDDLIAVQQQKLNQLKQLKFAYMQKMFV